jgi:hypothetical protein
LEYNLFSQLFKYKETSKLSPVENYLTELFAFLLTYLIEEKKQIAISLLSNLGINAKEDSYIIVETQWESWVEKYKHFARPDIKICIEKDVYFIESKIDSNINQYDGFDQIQLYEAIEIAKCNNKGVITLTKHEIYTNRKYNIYSDKNKKFWNEIFSFFSEKSELKSDILVNCFMDYLKENDMAEKQSLAYSSNGLENFYSLYSFLHTVLKDFALKNGYTENAIELDSNADYFGFSISYKKKKVIWCGCYSGSDDLVIQSYVKDEDVLISKIKNKIKISELERADYNNSLIFGKLSINELVKENNFERQKGKFNIFLTENNIEKILAVSWKIIENEE